MECNDEVNKKMEQEQIHNHLRSKTTFGDSFCTSYRLAYNVEWLAALEIPALLAIIMLTSQSASANMIGGFDCYGDWRCASGWNHAIVQAQSDWTNGHTEDSTCPPGHTWLYCTGWTNGYTIQWNDFVSAQSSQQLIQQQQCININSLGATCVQTEQGSQN